MTLQTSQAAVYIHVCVDSYSNQTLLWMWTQVDV